MGYILMLLGLIGLLVALWDWRKSDSLSSEIKQERIKLEAVASRSQPGRDAREPSPRNPS